MLPLTDTPDDKSLIAYSIQEIANCTKTPEAAFAELGADWADALADYRAATAGA